jgi:hypothetical protein
LGNWAKAAPKAELLCRHAPGLQKQKGAWHQNQAATAIPDAISMANQRDRIQ